LTVDVEGLVWVTEIEAGEIARLDPVSEAIREFPLPSARVRLHSILALPDGAVWCPESGTSKIARLGP